MLGLRRKLAFVVLLSMLFMLGCESAAKSIPTNRTTLEHEYLGRLSDVDQIELLDGSTGERKRISDPTIIQEWLDKIKHVELEPDENQEGAVGYLFSVSLFEGERKTFQFIPHELNGVYYETNEEFKSLIQAFFEEQYKRDF